MESSDETCSYAIHKEDHTKWDGDYWRLDKQPPAGINQDAWSCPHPQLDGDTFDYCAFHTDPERLPAHIDEAQLLLDVIDEVEDQSKAIQQRRLQFIGATFGRLDFPEDTTIRTSEEVPQRLTHAKFTDGIHLGDSTVRIPVIATETQFLASESHAVTFGPATFEHPISFRGASFGGDGTISFRGTQFEQGVSFRNTDFSGTGDISFIRAQITDRAIFENAAFKRDGDITFGGVSFTQGPIRFDSATFQGRSLSFRGANIQNCEISFEDTTLSGLPVSFDDTNFNGTGTVSFTRADFTGPGDISFDNADFTGPGDISFTRTDFSGPGNISFINTTFNGTGDATFWKVDLTHANLRQADFTGVNLNAADLTGVDLQGTTLSKSNLRDATLTDTKLDGSTTCGRQANHPQLAARLQTAATQLLHPMSLQESTQQQTDWDAMARSYYDLKARFAEHGLVGKARRHHMLEREARRMEALASRDLTDYAGSWISWLITGYGVDYRRVIAFMLLIFLPATAIYYTYGIPTPRTLSDSIYYSIVTFTTAPPTMPQPGLPRFAAMIETFLGTLLVVLLGYVLGNRESF